MARALVLGSNGDSAGLKATEHDFYALGRQGIKAHMVTVPGSDPADAWQREPGLMQATMTTLDSAPSAAEAVVDNYIEQHKDALRTDDPEARRGLDDTVRSVAAVLDDPVEARLLTLQTEQRRRALLSDADTAYDTAAKAEVVEQKLDQAAEQTRQPDQADRLGRAAGYVDRRGEEFDITGNRLQDAAATTVSPADARPEAERTVPYDRARESNVDKLTSVQRDARVTSAHGFSESTADAVSRAGIRGAQARPDRGGDVQRRGRARTR